MFFIYLWGGNAEASVVDSFITQKKKKNRNLLSLEFGGQKHLVVYYKP